MRVFVVPVIIFILLFKPYYDNIPVLQNPHLSQTHTYTFNKTIRTV